MLISLTDIVITFERKKFILTSVLAVSCHSLCTLLHSLFCTTLAGAHIGLAHQKGGS